MSNRGLTTSGSSGIHVCGGVEGEPTGFGVGNIIANNITFDNRDPGGPDGNGIQLDQHTHGNVVVGNLATGNDGGGISLYDSHDNILAYNLPGCRGMPMPARLQSMPPMPNSSPTALPPAPPR